jgi:uncharacterized protein (TIGR02145 family)
MKYFNVWQSIFLGGINLFALFLIFSGCSGDTLLDSVSNGETVTDIDGNVYQTIKIGNQWWMMENLKVTHYRNGDPIPNVTDQSTWTSLSTGAYCEYKNDADNVTTYGRLYNWYAVNNSQIVAPEGWHVPTDDEWKQLEIFLGMTQAEADRAGWRGTDEAGKLKEADTTHWRLPNVSATNESGFTALPGGFRDPSTGHFADLQHSTHFWSSTEHDNSFAWTRSLYSDHADIGRYHLHSKQYGFSIRCVKD